MYLSLQVSRNFSIWVGVIRSNWYSTRGWKDKGKSTVRTSSICEPLRPNSLRGQYLCCAVIIDAIFISGFLNLLRHPFNECFYFLKRLQNTHQFVGFSMIVNDLANPFPKSTMDIGLYLSNWQLHSIQDATQMLLLLRGMFVRSPLGLPTWGNLPSA